MSRYFNALLMLGASTVALTLPAGAQTKPKVETVTVTAMRVAELVKDVPVTVSVISADQIKNNLV